MTISLSNNAARVSYTVSQGATQSSFTVSFEFFDDDDLSLYVDGTLKTLTTHYTVSGGDGSTGTITMTSGNNVTGISGGSTVVITRDIDLDRVTDFPSSGPFAVATLNTELDRFTAIAADQKDEVDRALRLQDFDSAVSMTLPLKAARLGTVLGFNASTGAPEAGPTIANVNSLSAITTNINTVAGIQSNVTTVAGISSNVQTVANIASNVTTVAGIASNVTTVAGQTTNLANVTNNLSAIQNAATNAATATTKASEAATSATNAASSATSAASSASTATTKASEASTSATNAASSASTASTQASNASTSASTSSTQATNSANSATASANSATAAASSATAAASSATAAAASQTAAAASAASAASAFDSFDDRFLGSKTSNPSTDNDGDALVTGALYFNSTANEMRVYDGANWIAATSAGNVSLILYEYTATSNQTTFSGSDNNSATLSYTVDNLQVVMNGVILDPSDFTATNGTSVVLASGAAANDLVNIYAFKSFTTADMVSKSAGGTFVGNVGMGGTLTVTGNADFNGDLDVDGTTNLDVVDIDGAVDMASTLQVDGAITSSAGATITTADNTSQLTLKSTDADGSLGPKLDLTRDSSSPADGDNCGQINFKIDNDAGESTQYGDIFVGATDVSDGAESAHMTFSTMKGGSRHSRMKIHSDETVFNEDSVGTIDFRVESDSRTHMLFVDASADAVGIGTSSPNVLLHVFGSSAEVAIDDTGAEPKVRFRDNGSTRALLKIDSSNNYQFHTGPDGSVAEVGRFSSAGVFMVGKTSASFDNVGFQVTQDGQAAFTRDGSQALYVNRQTTDGPIVELRQDNDAQLLLGSKFTGRGYISTNVANSTGLRFDTNFIAPCDGTGANRDNVIDLGSSSARFDDIHATNSTIQTSDENEKQNITSLSDSEITAAKAISKLFKTFKFKDSVTAKGDAARTHTGVIAQQVQTAMTDAGLDATKYAFWCSDTWWETSTEVEAVEGVDAVYEDVVIPAVEAQRDGDGGVYAQATEERTERRLVKEKVEARDAYTRIDTYHTEDEAPEGATKRTRLGVRYPELLAFIGAATEQRLADIEARITKLENA